MSTRPRVSVGYQTFGNAGLHSPIVRYSSEPSLELAGPQSHLLPSCGNTSGAPVSKPHRAPDMVLHSSTAICCLSFNFASMVCRMLPVAQTVQNEHIPNLTHPNTSPPSLILAGTLGAILAPCLSSSPSHTANYSPSPGDSVPQQCSNPCPPLLPLLPLQEGSSSFVT